MRDELPNVIIRRYRIAKRGSDGKDMYIAYVHPQFELPEPMIKAGFYKQYSDDGGLTWRNVGEDMDANVDENTIIIEPPLPEIVKPKKQKKRKDE